MKTTITAAPPSRRDARTAVGPGLRRAALLTLLRRASPFLLLLALLPLLYVDVFFAGRTLLALFEPGLLPGPPFGYSGPISATAPTCDPGGSYVTDLAFDAFTAQTLRSGQFPFWNPHAAFGQPYLANGLSAVLYPVNWLCTILPPAWYDVCYLINFFLAAWFTMLYLRSLGLSTSASLVGAAAVFASGFFNLWLIMRDTPSSAAWWPLLLYGIERTIRTKGLDLRAQVALAVGVYASTTGGQPEVAALSFLTAFAYAIVRLAADWKTFRQNLVRLIPAPIAGLLLSSAAWLTLAQYAIQDAFSAHMPGNPVGLDHLWWGAVTTYVFPFLYGPMFQTPLAPDGFRFDTPGWFPCIGLFLSAMALVGLRRRTRAVTAFMGAVAILSLAKAWGLPFLNSIGSLPVLSRLVFFRYGGFLAAFAFAFLTATAAEELTEEGPPRRRWLLVAWIAAVVLTLGVGLWASWEKIQAVGLWNPDSQRLFKSAAIGLLWCLTAPFVVLRPGRAMARDPWRVHALIALGLLLQAIAYQPDGHSAPAILRRAINCLLCFGVAWVLIVQAHRLTRSRLALGSIVAAACIVPQVIILWTSPHGRPSRYDPLTPPPYVAKLRSLQQGNLYRSYSFDSSPHPNFSPVLGISMLNTAEALVPYPTVDFMHKCLDRYSAPFWFAGDRQRISPTAEFWRNKRYFDFIGIRYITTSGRTDLHMADYGLAGGWMPFALEQPAEIRVLSPVDSLSRVEVALHGWSRSNPGDVVLSVSDSTGRLLASSSIRGEGIRDYGYHVFAFDPIGGLFNKQIRLRLQFRPSSPDSMIGLLRSDDLLDWGFICRIPTREDPLDLVYTDPSTGIMIHENPDAVPRVFLATSATYSPFWQDAMDRMMETPDLTSHVRVEDPEREIRGTWPPGAPPGRLIAHSLQLNEARVAYEAFVPGILTVTDVYLPGWRATLNGQDVPILRVDGIFRGIFLSRPGRYDVHFSYRPPFWPWILWMTTMGFVVIALLLLPWHRLTARV